MARKSQFIKQAAPDPNDIIEVDYDMESDYDSESYYSEDESKSQTITTTTNH